MNDEEFEKALQVAQKVVFAKIRRYLSDVEVMILRGSWQGDTYEKIAETSSYSPCYLGKDVGKKLWKLLSEVLGEVVSKKNFRQALLRHVGKEQLLDEAIASAQSTPAVDLESPEGSSALDSPFYVERPPIESLCYATIEQPGCLIRIKAPKGMGKTLLSAKILDYAARQGYQKVYLNLNQADFTNLDAFLRWLCLRVGQKLRLPNQLENFWDERFSTSTMNCTEYFEQYLLAEIHSPLALCLDEVDLLFPHSEIAEGFLPLLRSWHEEAKIEDVWKRVRLIVVHSKEVYIPLNINQSPFNVGLPIELPEFTPEQVGNLAKLYGLDLSVASIEQLMTMVGGHPELVQQAISHLRNHQEVELEPLLETAPTEEGIYRNHLRRLWQSLQEQPELVEALKKVVAANSPVRLEATLLYKLHSMGLVQLEGNNCSPRCNLYRQYFCDRVGVGE